MPAQTQRPAQALDPGRCPLCGAVNGCAMVQGDGEPGAAKPADCWCMATRMAPGVLDRIAAPLRGQACICARCARG